MTYYSPSSPTSKSANLKYVFPVLVIGLLVAGVGYLMYGDFPQVREKTIEVWYVEEIPDPYTGSGTIIQVIYKDYLGNHAILLKKTDLSSSITQGKYLLSYETDDKLWKKTKPWILTNVAQVS